MFTKGNVQEYVDSIIKGRLRTDASLWRQDNVLIFTFFTFFTFGELPSSFSRLTDPKCKLEIESSREGRCSQWIANQQIILVEGTLPRKLIVDFFFAQQTQEIYVLRHAQEGENICSQWMDIAAELLSVSDWWWGRRIVITIANCGDAFFVYREFSFLLALICFFRQKMDQWISRWYNNSISIKTLSQIKTRNRNGDTKIGSRGWDWSFCVFRFGILCLQLPIAFRVIAWSRP